MVKLIVSDLDDTLLSNDLTISPANLHAIAQARAQGIIFTFATGRMFVSSLPYAKQLELPGDVPLICYQCTHPAHRWVIYKNPLPHAWPRHCAVLRTKLDHQSVLRMCST